MIHKYLQALSKPFAVLVSLLVYVLVLLLTISAMYYLNYRNPLKIIFIGNIIATVLIFVFSLLANNSSMYDPYWSLQPLVNACAFVYLSPWDLTNKQIIVLIVILLYSLRLTANFYRGWKGFSQEDWRYVDFRLKFPHVYWLISFFGIHLFPTLLVFAGCLPLFAVLFLSPNTIGLLDIAALIVSLFAIILAFVSDEQKRKFLKSNHGTIVNKGLWAYVRHPNYLGEILTWWGILLFAISVDTAYYWTGIGALLITLMFVFISIPLMEKHMSAKPGYKAYRDKTGNLLPKF
jgi:steroid 5-alpha reductase family enzyme